VWPAARASEERAASWKHGFLFRRLFPKKFSRIRAKAEEDAARAAELREQMALSCIPTEIDVPSILAEPYRRLVHAFRAVAGSAATWDTIAARATNRVAERTTADHAIERKTVLLRVSTCDVIDFGESVPCLSNRNGADLYVFPAFVVVQGARGMFAVLDLRQVRLEVAETAFQEEETVPRDAAVIGYTWLRANMDGSQDRRFSDNREIPVVRYGRITITADSGLNEEWLVSNADATLAFGNAWAALVACLQTDPA
jgi:hypothetical protein